MANSKLFKWNFADFAKGLFVAVVSAVLTAVLQMLTNEPPALDYKQIGVVAITSAIAYLLKQLSTNNQGQLFAKDGDETDIGGGGIKNPTKP